MTTKQLRDNMAQAVVSLQKGESITLSYRHKVIGTLEPTAKDATTPQRGSAAAIAEFLQQADFGVAASEIHDSTQTFKQELAALRDAELDR